MTQERLFQAVEDYRLGKNQDEAAMIIYDGTSRSALAVIMKHCSRKSEHEDILQITFMNVFNHLGDLKDITKIQSWVNTIASYTAMRYGKQLHPELYQDVTDEEGNFPDFVDERPENQPEAFIESDAQHHAINEAMDTLPQAQKDAILMLYAEQLPAKEAAERQGVSVNTVRSRAFQGLKKLEKRKDIFQKHGVEITAVPLTLLIFSTFQRDVYAAEISAESMTILSAARNGIVNAMAGTSAEAGTGAGAAKAAAGTGTKAAAAGKNAATVKAGTAMKAGTAAKAASVGLGVKIAAGAVAVAVVVGGGAAAVSHVGNSAPVQESPVSTEAVTAVAAPVIVAEQTEVSPNYITLYATHLENGDGREDYTYTYEYEFTSDGKIARLTEPISYRYGEGVSGYQITEYDDYENELTEAMLEDDGKTVITYQNEYDGDLLIKSTAYRDDGTERVKRYEYDEDGVKVSQIDEWLNEESYYERNEDGTLAKTLTTKTKNGEVTRIVTTEFFYDENGIRTGSIQTQENSENGENTTDRIVEREYSYDESGVWRKQIRTNNGKTDLIYIDVSQQYLFEHPNAAVPDELDFPFFSTGELYTVEELEAMAGGNNSAIEDSSEDSGNTSNLPAVDIGSDTPMKHITINGVELRLPMPVTDFLATGLELNGGRDYVEEDHYVIFETPVDGGTLEILVSNPYHGFPEEQANWMDCYVAGVMYDSSMCSGEGFRAENHLTGQTTSDELDHILGATTSYYDNTKVYQTDDYRIIYTYPDQGGLTVTDMHILFSTYGGVYEGEDSIYLSETETTVASETESTLNSIEETVSIVSEDSMSSELELSQDGTYYSSDGQMVCFDFAEMIVVITGYGEEGKYTSEYPFYWTNSTTARRDIGNSTGDSAGYQDYIPSEEGMTVATYNLDGVQIGSFLDGEFYFEEAE